MQLRIRFRVRVSGSVDRSKQTVTGAGGRLERDAALQLWAHTVEKWRYREAPWIHDISLV